MKALFFSDVDGTLIDHNTYSHDLSLKGINLLKKNSIPLIPVSSKTYDEMTVLMKKLCLETSFIFENGSGIAYLSDVGSEYKVELYGPGVEKLMEFIPELEKITGKPLKTILSLTVDEISSISGLDPESAGLAKKRISTIPFIMEEDTLFSGPEIMRLNRELQKHKFSITKGGRFNHLMPAFCGKDYAVKKIIEFYRDKYDDEIITAAAGDGLNDIPMLAAVDYPYIIRRHDGSFMEYAGGNVMNSCGPSGFTEAVVDFMKIITG